MAVGNLMIEDQDPEDKKHQELFRTPVATQIISSSFAACFYVFLLVLNTVSVHKKSMTKLCTSSNLVFMFFLGLLLVVVATLVNSQDDSAEVRQVFRIVTGIIIGILYVIWGAWKLFEKPYEQTGERKLLKGLPMLGNLQPSMGLVVGWITFPVIVIELIILIGSKRHTPGMKIHTNSSTDENHTSNFVKPLGQLNIIHTLHMCLRGVYLVQKIVQALVYSLLRGSVAVAEYKEQAVFFFRVMAFLNFALWMDCITFTEIDAELDNLSQSYGSANGIIEVVYDALIIDYRLLCSLLFLEHSYHMVVRTSQTGYVQMHQHRFVPAPRMSLEEKRIKNLGVCCGLTCVLFEIVMSLHYKKELDIGPEIHLLSISVSFFIIICGSMMFWVNNLKDDSGTEMEGHAVDLMVCCMGCTGLVCWLIKGSISAYWASCYSDGELGDYMNWASAKLFIRAILVAFMIVVFSKVKLDKIINRNRNVRWNYFFVSVIMFGMLAVFLGSAVDQYTGTVDHEFEENVALLHVSIQFLLHIGPPFHLGFCIHIFLHFLLIRRKMGLEWAKIDDGRSNMDDTPLLDEPLEHTLLSEDFHFPDFVENSGDHTNVSEDEE